MIFNEYGRKYLTCVTNDNYLYIFGDSVDIGYINLNEIDNTNGGNWQYILNAGDGTNDNFLEFNYCMSTIVFNEYILLFGIETNEIEYFNILNHNLTVISNTNTILYNI